MHTHYFVSFSRDIYDTPYAGALSDLGADFRLIGGTVDLHYRTRLWLYLVGWPKSVALGFKKACRSLFAHPRPGVVVVGTDIEVLSVAFLHKLLFRRAPKIVFVGFILTDRPGSLVNRLRHLYFSLVLSQAELVFSHSKAEVGKYQRRFPDHKEKFLYIHFGTHLTDSDDRPALDTAGYIFSAGRSGRDYHTLVESAVDLPYPVRIACDYEAVLPSRDVPGNVAVLRRCYGADYFSQLKEASLVVIPLTVDDVSAGQMVLIQSMAYGRPVIITRTATTEEYVEHGIDAYLVPRGDARALADAIRLLMTDRALAASIGRAGARTFERIYSMGAFVKTLHQTISDRLGPDRRLPPA